MPLLTVTITANNSPIEGQTYSLTCDLMGEDSLAVTQRNIRWDQLSPTFMREVHRGATLSFDPLSCDDGGQYQCITNIRSPYTTINHTRTESTTFTVTCK